MNILCAALFRCQRSQRSRGVLVVVLVHSRTDVCFATSTWQTDAGAIRFVLLANIIAGLQSEDGRLPDLVLPKALDMMLTGKNIRAMAVGQVLMWTWSCAR